MTTRSRIWGNLRRTACDPSNIKVTRLCWCTLIITGLSLEGDGARLFKLNSWSGSRQKGALMAPGISPVHFLDICEALHALIKRCSFKLLPPRVPLVATVILEPGWMTFHFRSAPSQEKKDYTGYHAESTQCYCNANTGCGTT